MTEFSGLQIDPRCIKCGNPPTADAPLLEMQNHLYICDRCRREEERKGKRIIWAGGAQMENLTVPLPPVLQTRPLSNPVPRNSIFGILEVPPSAPSTDVQAAIEQKMRFWMFAPDSEEKGRTIELLREWQEAVISDPEFLEKQRAAIQPAKPKGSSLSIGSTKVYSAQEFVDACEASPEGWRDGEQVLRQGELQYWVEFQLGNRLLANEIGRLADATGILAFRALNRILYLLAPERPFRLYSQDTWQSPSTIPCASDPKELAQLCDTHWEHGEGHLYQGSMLVWLEHSQGCRGLSEYYESFIKSYERDRANRGLGLELLLERAVPSLPRPKLVVTFDGIKGEYKLESWDREIPHQPITVKVNNTTRGFTSLTLELVKKSKGIEPDWIVLEGSIPPSYLNSYSSATPYSITPYSPQPAGVSPYPRLADVAVPVPLQGRPGGRPSMRLPQEKKLRLINLPFLKHGKKYERVLRMSQQREYGQPPVVVGEYSISLKTMGYFQGFRGHLWRWGLRGNLPGFFWNSVAGVLLALISFLLVPTLAHSPYTSCCDPAANQTFGTALQESFSGVMDLEQSLAQFFHLPFVLIVGALTGIIGLGTGFGQGHTNYTEKNSARNFRRSAFWWSLLSFVALFFLNHRFNAIGDALQSGGGYAVAGTLWYVAGSLMTCFLFFLTACGIALLRSQTETFLRKQHAALLTPPGREQQDVP